MEFKALSFYGGPLDVDGALDAATTAAGAGTRGAYLEVTDRLPCPPAGRTWAAATSSGTVVVAAWDGKAGHWEYGADYGAPWADGLVLPPPSPSLEEVP
jgi:hypothetical protein